MQTHASSQHAVVTEAARQAARDGAWWEGFDEDERFMLDRKRLKRNAWRKAAAYARAARRRYAVSSLRAYKRTRWARARRVS